MYLYVYIYIILYNMLYTYAIHRKEAGQRLLQTCVEKFARLTSLVLDKHLERLSPRNIVHSWIKDLRHGGKKELGRESNLNDKLRNTHIMYIYIYIHTSTLHFRGKNGRSKKIGQTTQKI